MALTIDELLLKRTVELFDYSPHLLNGIIDKIEFIDQTTLYINSLIEQVNTIESLVYESANRILSQFLVDGTLTIAVQNVVTPLTQPYIDSLNQINVALGVTATNVQAVSSQLNTIQIQSTNDASTIISFQNTVNNLQSQIQTVLDNLTNLMESVSDLIENFSNLLITINSINTQLQNLSDYPLNTFSDTLTNIQTNIQTITNFVSNANTELTTNLSTLSTFETQINTNASNLQPLADSVNTIVNQTSNWVDTVNSMVIALNVISGDFDATNTALDNENTNITTTHNDFNTAQTNHNTNLTNFNNNTTSLQTLVNQISGTQNVMNETTTITYNDSTTQSASLTIFNVSPLCYHCFVSLQFVSTPPQSQFSTTFTLFNNILNLTNTSGTTQNILIQSGYVRGGSTTATTVPTFHLQVNSNGVLAQWISQNISPNPGTVVEFQFYIFQGQGIQGVIQDFTPSDTPYYMDDEGEPYYI